MPSQNADVAEPETQVLRPAGAVASSQFCRVTVLAPRLRMDLALPTDLTIAELVPMLTELAGETGGRRSGRARATDRAQGTASDSAVPASWCLAAAAGAELPPQATLASLGVLDGDLLRLRPRADAPPRPVFDDPVDAVAEAVRIPDGSSSATTAPGAREPFTVWPWTERGRRTAGLAGAALCAVAASGLLLALRLGSDQPQLIAATIAAIATVVTLASGARLARTDSTAGVVLASASVPFAATTGVTALPGAPGAGHLLLAAALASATAGAGLALLRTAAPVLVASVLAGGLTALAALLAVFDAGSAGGLAAAAAAASVGLLPLLPRISIQLAGLPPPLIPTTQEDMIAADERWEHISTEEIRYQAQLAHTYLAGLILGAVSVAGVGAILAARTDGWAGPAFASVVIAVLLLRSRGSVTMITAVAPLGAGALAAAGLMASLAVAVPAPASLVGAPVLLVAAGVGLWLVRAGTRREPSPVLRRAVDIVEAVLVVATFPLALAVLDLFRLVRQL